MTTPGKRLDPSPSQQVDQSKPFNIYYDGKPVPACSGDTVASALFAGGRRIFSRSFKYHRPRGLLCGSGDCPNCIMEIDGKPNIRACLTPVRDGMQVLSQHAWPSVDHDVLRIIESFDRFLPIGFYYKTLYKPRLLWEIAEPVIRNLAGMGRVRNRETGHTEYKYRYEYVDMLVVGGGAGRIEAALTAANAGASVLLVDKESRVGGHLRYESRSYRYEETERPGYEVARLLESAVVTHPKISVLFSDGVGGYEGNLVPVLQGNTLVHVRYKSVLLATGCHQYPAVFDNNDLPGVMLSRATLRLIHLFGLLPGGNGVVATANDEGYFAALECLRAGMKIAALVDARPSSSIRRKPRSCKPSACRYLQNEDSGGDVVRARFRRRPSGPWMEIPSLSSALWLAIRSCSPPRGRETQLCCSSWDVSSVWIRHRPASSDKDADGRVCGGGRGSGIAFAAGDSPIRTVERNGRRTTYATGKTPAGGRNRSNCSRRLAGNPRHSQFLRSQDKRRILSVLRRRSGEGSTTRSGRRFRRKLKL